MLLLKWKQQQFADVFKGFGTLPFTYKIQLKENAQPIVLAPCRVPAPLYDALKKERDRMTDLGVIRKVEEPTDWVNSVVITKKRNGELRTCMDPKDLNESIKHEHYQHYHTWRNHQRNDRSKVLHKAGCITRLLAVETGWKQIAPSIHPSAGTVISDCPLE